MERSPLSRLPAELRLAIYELAVSVSNKDTTITIIPIPRIPASPASFDYRVKTPDNDMHPLALTQTCRAIHLECSTLFYKLNTFHFQNEEGLTVEALKGFAKLIGPTAFSAVARVEIEVDIDILVHTVDRCPCQEEEKELLELRRWALQHPRLALSAWFHEEGEPIAIVDISSLSKPVVKEVEEFSEMIGGVSFEEFRRRLEEWQEEFRTGESNGES